VLSPVPVPAWEQHRSSTPGQARQIRARTLALGPQPGTASARKLRAGQSELQQSFAQTSPGERLLLIFWLNRFRLTAAMWPEKLIHLDGSAGCGYVCRLERRPG
jgi:hypothetical protein